MTTRRFKCSSYGVYEIRCSYESCPTTFLGQLWPGDEVTTPHCCQVCQKDTEYNEIYKRWKKRHG